MGVVYEGLDVRLDRRVAIKVLRPELAADAEARARFEREARNASRVVHENVVGVYDFGVHEDTPYLVMEYLEGESLFDRIRRGPMDIDEVVRVVVPTSLGLARAHALGIVHRDLKPENIVLAQVDGQLGPTPKLVDFGVAFLARSTEARLTGRDLVVGTLAYLAPEQLEPEYEPDARADQYALAVTTYECLAGRSPIAHGTPREILARKAQGRYTALRTHRPDLPDALERVLAKAMATEPSERYNDVRVFACALLDHASEATRARWGELIGYRRTTFVERGNLVVPDARTEEDDVRPAQNEHRRGRSRRAVAAVAVGVVGVAIFGALAWDGATSSAPTTSLDGGPLLDAEPPGERDSSTVVVAAGLSGARDGSSVVDEDAALGASDVVAPPRRRDAGGDGANRVGGSGVALGSSGKSAGDVERFGRSGVGTGGGEVPKSVTTGVVRGGDIDLGGAGASGLSREEIKRVMSANNARVRRCYEERLSAVPTLEGKLKIRVTIGPSGEVSEVVEEGPTLDATVSRCVLATVRRFTFPRPRNGGVVRFVWPIVFRSAP